MTATLVDVAKAANVSVATASRVLTKSSHPISDQTRQRVLKSASLLGYQPNWLARGMRTERTNTIGIIADDLVSAFTPPIIRGIQDFLRTIDYLGLIVNSDWDPALEQAAIRTLLGRSVDGMIFVESGHLSPTQELEQAGKPFMFVHRLFGASIQHSVVPDDYAGSQLALQHLLRLGHRRIAHIAGPSGWHSARRRVDGYLDFMQAQGLVVENGWLVESDWQFDGGVAAAQQIVALPARPTAIYVANDYMAWGAIEAIRSVGLRVPEDVAVVGYDNLSFSRVIRPKLTTVSLPAYEMGEQAARQLAQKLQGEAVAADEVKICGSLYIRESCGADPSWRTDEEAYGRTGSRNRMSGLRPITG